MVQGLSGRSGPPPDPNSLKASGDWIDLPPEGRDGPTPDWPLSQPTVRELKLWVSVWRRPQAVMWEHNHQQLEVAMFVRSLAVAEHPRSSTPPRALVRQQMEALGISLPGMLRNRWRIPGVETPEPVSGVVEPRPSVRDRLKVVGDGRS